MGNINYIKCPELIKLIDRIGVKQTAWELNISLSVIYKNRRDQIASRTLETLAFYINQKYEETDKVNAEIDGYRDSFVLVYVEPEKEREFKRSMIKLNIPILHRKTRKS